MFLSDNLLYWMIQSNCLQMHARERILTNGCFKNRIEIQTNWLLQSKPRIPRWLISRDNCIAKSLANLFSFLEAKSQLCSTPRQQILSSKYWRKKKYWREEKFANIFSRSLPQLFRFDDAIATSMSCDVIRKFFFYCLQLQLEI